MARATNPATPAAEIEARRNWRGPTLGGGVLTADLAAFCESGISVVIASVAAPRVPVISPGLGCRVSQDGSVRVLLWGRVGEPVLAALRAGGGIAVTMTRPYTHRAIQVKGKTAAIAQATAEDETVVRKQARAFADDLVSVGYRPDFAATYVTFLPGELVALDFVPDGVFVQTPGPRAGAALVPE